MIKLAALQAFTIAFSSYYSPFPISNGEDKFHCGVCETSTHHIDKIQDGLNAAMMFALFCYYIVFLTCLWKDIPTENPQSHAVHSLYMSNFNLMLIQEMVVISCLKCHSIKTPALPSLNLNNT